MDFFGRIIAVETIQIRIVIRRIGVIGWLNPCRGQWDLKCEIQIQYSTHSHTDKSEISQSKKVAKNAIMVFPQKHFINFNIFGVT